MSEVVKYGVAGIIAVGVIAWRLWVASARRDIADLDRRVAKLESDGAKAMSAEAAEAAFASEADARRKGDEALALRLTAVEVEARTTERTLATHIAIENDRRARHE